MARAHEKARLSGARSVRLDTLLVERGLAPTRARARAFIMEGAVVVNGARVDKAGEPVAPDAAVQVVSRQSPYVSRGGLKLEAALERFGLDPTGWVVTDIGSSTGGFTDCWLRHGAVYVYAVDVGYGQLANTLRDDPRVEVHERTNARYLTREHLRGPLPVAASMDVSFIDPRLILPALDAVMGSGWTLVELVKPQFLVGREHVGKGGIVRDPSLHARALEEALAALVELGLAPQGAMPSPVRGQKGNREFLVWAVQGAPAVTVRVDDVVHEAWEETSR